MLLGRTHGKHSVRLCLKSALRFSIKRRLLIILDVACSLRVSVSFFVFVLLLEAEKAD